MLMHSGKMVLSQQTLKDRLVRPHRAYWEIIKKKKKLYVYLVCSVLRVRIDYLVFHVGLGTMQHAGPEMHCRETDRFH